MKTTRLVRAMVVALIACLTVGMTAACNRGGGNEGTKIVFAVSTLNNPYFISLRDGARAAAQRAGVTIEVVDAQNDATTQQNQLANAVTQGADAVLINPVDSKAAAAAVRPALDADIPVVAVDRSVQDEQITSTVRSDNVAGGKKAATALADSIDEKGEVIALQGVPGTSASRQRGEGFDQGIESYSDIDVAAKQPANFSRTKALNVTTNLLQSNPDVAGIFAENDEMALGAVQALSDRAAQEVEVVGFDGTEEGMKAVADGEMAATIAQQPAKLGRTAVNLAEKAVSGKKVPEQRSVEVKTVTKQNVEKFRQ
ncbi:ribose transport system substrate-binding protein [Actinopolyspora biskrensis]|uniref:Ribose transport system substrate-binding protein n=2 Tax=Actinopolyspora biskrensis TaxID=1470178 RepID=A0A852YXG9_9ACTN|nr:substrate-binding domain-containing protein [Actinopolyspora biskrensis]NYH77625.1 ribose transport system substrate-binding protein [Actinopolyspora biskrensis]